MASWEQGWGGKSIHVACTSRFVLLNWSMNHSYQLWSPVSAAKPWLLCLRHRSGRVQRGLKYLVAIAGTYSHSSASFPIGGIANSCSLYCSTWSRKCAQTVPNDIKLCQVRRKQQFVSSTLLSVSVCAIQFQVPLFLKLYKRERKRCNSSRMSKWALEALR